MAIPILAGAFTIYIFGIASVLLFKPTIMFGEGGEWYRSWRTANSISFLAFFNILGFRILWLSPCNNESFCKHSSRCFPGTGPTNAINPTGAAAHDANEHNNACTGAFTKAKFH